MGSSPGHRGGNASRRHARSPPPAAAGAVGHAGTSHESGAVARAPFDDARLGRDGDGLACERNRELLDRRSRVEPEPRKGTREPGGLRRRPNPARDQRQPIGDRRGKRGRIDGRCARTDERVAGCKRAGRVRARTPRAGRVPEAARAERLGVLGERGVRTERRIRIGEIGSRIPAARTPRRRRDQ
jgi:hypothetical protein